MVHVLVLVVLIGFMVFMQRRSFTGNDRWAIGIGISSVVLLFVLLGMLMGYADGVSNVERLEELRSTVEKHGQRKEHMEDIFGQVTALNQELRADKRWNRNFICDPFIYDGWAELEPIKLPN